MKTNTLAPELLQKMDAYWRAANYLSVGQIYLYDNPLLKRPLALADVKQMLLGHWGTTPGQNFIYVHLNRDLPRSQSGRSRATEAVSPVFVPRRDPEPRIAGDPRFDPRGRGAGL